MKKLATYILFFCVFSVTATAQMPVQQNSSDILLQMKKLNVLGSVLYIAAHPDDENTRLLAWMSKEKLYRTGYLSLTRGDGGQNLIGDEQGIELGLIRTQELLAARRVDGADQFFSRAYDFGFSKTTAEALKIWNEQKILSDVVWVIRKFQPDVIITRFPEDKRAGHGQHSASSVLAHIAFSAAADSTQFPEQFSYGVKPWQAKRIFWNNYNFGSVNTIRDDQLKVEVGGFNPLVGKSYGEIAADSRSQHRSQGFGVAHTRGNNFEYFSLTAGEPADSSLMQHVNYSWSRVPLGKVVEQKIDELIRKYDPANPEKSDSELVSIYTSMEFLPPGYWRDEKMNEVVGLIQACSGLYAEATTTDPYALYGQTVPVTCRIINRSGVSINLLSVGINQQDTTLNQELKTGVNFIVTRKISLGNLPISQPYWLVEPMSPGSYNVNDQRMIGEPDNSPALNAVFTFQLFGKVFSVHREVFYNYTDAVKGERFEPVTIVPEHMAVCLPSLLVFGKQNIKRLTVSTQTKTTFPDSAGFSRQKSDKSRSNGGQKKFLITPVEGIQSALISSSENTISFRLQSGIGKNRSARAWVTDYEKKDTLLQCRTISYEHIPRIDYFKKVGATLVTVNLKIAGRRVGYVEGAGDKLPEALAAMGYTVIPLNENSATAEMLHSLDAVVAGVRAYEVHDWMILKYQLLMNYVRDGGNLIVQYNRNLGADSAGIGPYPFGISSARITEEDAPVKFLLPFHQVLHFPNEISNADFEGWIQERGIYFATHIDPKYETIFSMHDSNEADLNGSLITGRYGKGYFTYTGLVFFRELPAGVPGAYRLLANLIALNQHKHTK